ncbi:MAG TPA: hypothetical protein VGE59_02275 [Patescibacteria group bacterium]
MIPVTYGATTVNSRINRPGRAAARIGFFSVRMIGFLMLAILALLYIAQSSQATTKRLDVQSTRQQADLLTTEEDQLRLEAKRLQSLDTISQSATTLQLEPVQSVEFLSPAGSN